MSHALEKGLEVLLLFRDGRPRTIAEISEVLALPRSTAYRLVSALCSKGFLEQAERWGTYHLGLTVLELARAVREETDLVAACRPIMVELAARTEESVFLSVPRGLVAVCIERVESPRMLRITAEPGTVLPLFAAAPAKVLLAFMSREQQQRVLANQALIRPSDGGPIDEEALQRDLREIRRLGYSVSEGEAIPEGRAVAVPIFDPSGTVVASLCIAGPRERIDLGRVPELVQALREGAQQVEAKLRRLAG